MNEIVELFDMNGRRIPHNLKATVCDPDKNCFLLPPISYNDRFIKGFTSTGLNASMTLPDFSNKAKKLFNQLRSSKQLANLLKAPSLPIIIPKTNLIDLWKIIEFFISAACISYESHFMDLHEIRSFTNTCRGKLEGRAAVVEGSKYSLLLERIQWESLVAIYFPTVLQGYSVPSQVQQMSTLPDGFILSGPIDTAIAFAMYPDVLGRDDNTPIYDCSAVSLENKYTCCFISGDKGLNFTQISSLEHAREEETCGLLYIG